MNTQIPHTSVENYHVANRCFSWSAVIVGAQFGIGISFLLNLFALGIGLSAFTMTATQTLAVGGMIGLIIISIVSMGTLGWISGFIGASKNLCCHEKMHCNHGCIYGFAAWCLALVLSMLLALPATHLISQSVYTLNPALNNGQSYRYNLYHPSNKYINVNTNDISTNMTANEAIKNTSMSEEETHKMLICTTFIAFLLFFIGAISASIGGHIGYGRYSKTEY